MLSRNLILSITVLPPSEGQRLDLAVIQALSDQARAVISRNRLKLFFLAGHVRLDGRIVGAAERVLAGTHEVILENFEADEKTLNAAASPTGAFLNILYEDENILILDKKSDVPSVPLTPDETQTAVSSALAHLPSLAGIGHSPLEPGLLHRLDTATSGVLVFAKTKPEFERLKLLWKTPSVEKTYQAWVLCSRNRPLPSAGVTIDEAIVRLKQSSKRVRVATQVSERDRRGKPMAAVTRVVTANPTAPAKVSSTEPGSGIPFCLTLQIETGVMHQIRCHCSSRGWPILGDLIYGKTPSSRLWLHAWKIRLPLLTGEILEVESPLPDHWENP